MLSYALMVSPTWDFQNTWNPAGRLPPRAGIDSGFLPRELVDLLREKTAKRLGVLDCPNSLDPSDVPSKMV